MARLTREQFMEAVDNYTRDRTDDETLEFIRVMKDHIDSDDTDTLVANVEAEWREKYRKAFFDAPQKEGKDSEFEEKRESYQTYESLFSKKN